MDRRHMNRIESTKRRMGLCYFFILHVLIGIASPCHFKEQVTMSCRPDSVQLQLQLNGDLCSEEADFWLYINGDSTPDMDNMCQVSNDGLTEIDYGNKCLTIADNVITGYLHLARVDRGLETFTESPVSFSCSPPDTFVLYTAGTYGIDDVNHNDGDGLHQFITVPNSKVAVYDLVDHAETTQVHRGDAYQAVITLGDTLFERYTMNVTMCEVGDAYDHFDVIIENNKVVNGMESMFSVADPIAYAQYPTFAFNFEGFRQVRLNEFRFKCVITLVVNKREVGEPCTGHDECPSGICFYSSFFHFTPHFDQLAIKTCLPHPAEFHACENDDDCGVETNPLVTLRPTLDVGYLAPTVQMFCHSSDMLTTDLYDLRNEQVDNSFRDKLTTAVAQEHVWPPLGYVDAPTKICFAPLDLYRHHFTEINQIAACSDDKQCLSGQCNQASGECRRLNNERCTTDDDCISGVCTGSWFLFCA